MKTALLILILGLTMTWSAVTIVNNQIKHTAIVQASDNTPNTSSQSSLKVSHDVELLTDHFQEDYDMQPAGGVWLLEHPLSPQQVAGSNQ